MNTKLAYLAAILAISLTACGGGSSSPDTDHPPAPAPTPDPAPDPTPDPTPNPQPGDNTQCTAGSTQKAVCTTNGLSGTHTRSCNTSGTWDTWSNCSVDPLLPSAAGNIYYVSASGSNIADDPQHGSDTAPWRSPQYAVDQLHPGDTLIVRRGYYSGLLTIDASGTSTERITIRAETPHSAKLTEGITVNGDYVTIYGFDIEQAVSGSGIVINETQGVEILNNQIHDCPMYGINVASPLASNYTISNNTLSYNGQIGIIARGDHGILEDNNILEVVAYHPKLSSVNVNNGDDADGMVVSGTNHRIEHNLIANYSDPKDTHNYYLADPSHNAHADCFDMREASSITIERNRCWSNFHVSKGVILNGSGGSARQNITIRNNIFEFRDVGIRMPGNSLTIQDSFVYNNLLKAKIDDVIESYYNPGTFVDIPGDCISMTDVSNHAVFNNITVDCDNHTTQGVTGNPVRVTGGSGFVDYNFSWNSDAAIFSGADPGAHGSLTLDPGFKSFDSNIHGKNDYRLQGSSALIGQGTGLVSDQNSNSITVTDDLDGFSRPQDSSYEPGPYEYSASNDSVTPELISAHVDNTALELSPSSCASPASPIDVEIAHWSGNKAGAMIIRFDDSTLGQALCGLKAFSDRHLTGTWYINPGRDNFNATVNHPGTGDSIVISERWGQAPALGQELANHTMNHSYETSPSLWRSEVEQAADVIWGIRHGMPLQKNASLIAFNNSSSVAWPWAPKDEAAILSDFSNIERQTYMGPVYQAQANPTFSVPAGTAADAMYCGHPSLVLDNSGQCIDSNSTVYSSGVNRAIDSGVVYQAAFHGILSTDSDNCDDYTNSGSTDSGNAGVQFSELESFLDKVSAKTNELWVAGAIELYKYTQEAQRSNIRMHQSCSDRIYFDLASPLNPLYDEPLTLVVTVPSDWSSCSAIQGQTTLDCNIRQDGTVMIDAIPNRGRIALFRQ